MSGPDRVRCRCRACGMEFESLHALERHVCLAATPRDDNGGPDGRLVADGGVIVEDASDQWPSADEAVRMHGVAADGGDVVGPALEECPVCGAVGLPERIDDHDCQSFLEREVRADGGSTVDEWPDTADGDQSSLEGFADDQPALNAYDGDQDGEDEDKCACEIGDPGCFSHFDGGPAPGWDE